MFVYINHYNVPARKIFQTIAFCAYIACKIVCFAWYTWRAFLQNSDMPIVWYENQASQIIGRKRNFHKKNGITARVMPQGRKPL